MKIWLQREIQPVTVMAQPPYPVLWDFCLLVGVCAMCTYHLYQWLLARVDDAGRFYSSCTTDEGVTPKDSRAFLSHRTISLLRMFNCAGFLQGGGYSPSPVPTL